MAASLETWSEDKASRAVAQGKNFPPMLSDTAIRQNTSKLIISQKRSSMSLPLIYFFV